MEFGFLAIPTQKGRIAIITGANAGLGYETTKWFVQKDIKVIMACRNLEKADRAKTEILKEYSAADIEVMKLDLSSLKSVRSFASEFLAKYEKLDLLINNAGIMIPPYSKTEDGFESQMGANYFGHFLLTSLLLDVINNTPNARIVSLSSNAHRSGKINFDDIHWEKKYSRMKAYSQSKVACLMFALELQDRLENTGQKTLSLAAHPGVSNTELGKYIPRVLYYLLFPFFSFLTHSPKNGALPTVMAALDPNVERGEYFGPTNSNEMKGEPGRAIIYKHALDQADRKKLWELSEKLTAAR